MLRSVVAICVLALCATAARASELPPIPGMYQQGGQPLPMLDSKVEVTVRGPLVEVIVTQRFTNRADHATEATYIFPLPPDAAVSAMWIRTGAKTIRAKIAKRDEAQQRYEAAVRAGVTAAVLDQERPDIFTQTVAGIPARGSVEVVLRYDALAHFYDGAWGLALPMVVAPRYVAGTATARPTTGSGRAPDTNRAPDASRVTPGGAPGAGGPTAVTITYADKAWDITSPTHELAVSGQQVTFTDPRSDHDAIIRWKAPNVAGWVEQDPGAAFAAVVVEAPPPQLARKGALRCLLVLDRSAASRGDADALAQPLVRHFLAGLDAGDRVAVAGSDAIAWSAPPVIQRALDQVWRQRTGPFDLTRVLQQARPDGAPIVLVTGGLVADDRAAIAAAKRLGVPVHVIGVGPAPARGLLMQLATATGGTARFANPGDDLPALARAVIADAVTPAAPLTVNWGTLAASDVVPGTLPRLGTGQAVLVLARVERARTANARAGGELFAIDVLPRPRTVDGATTPIGPLGRRWARSRLEEMLATGASAAKITAFALQYGLVSPSTSMVAIGDEVVVQGGTRRSIAVPVSVPAGMKWQAVKKETTVEISDTREEKPADRKPVTKQSVKRPEPQPSRPEPTTSVDGNLAEDEEDKDLPRKFRGDEEDDLGVDAPAQAPPRDVAATGTVESFELASQSAPGLIAPRLRLTTSFAGGFVRARGESAGLLAFGARVEFGRTFLAGIDASLLVVGGDDLQGRVMISAARYAFARYLELGAAIGSQFGAGFGPAGALSLRYHLPPAPRGAMVLRYDGAYLVEDDEGRGQHHLTLGVEWGF